MILLDALKHIVIDNPTQLTGGVINPFGQALFLRQPQFAEMDSLTEGMTLARTDHKGKLEMKATTDYPVGLSKALSALFEGRSEVFRAWILSRAKGETQSSTSCSLSTSTATESNCFPVRRENGRKVHAAGRVL